VAAQREASTAVRGVDNRLTDTGTCVSIAGFLIVISPDTVAPRFYPALYVSMIYDPTSRDIGAAAGDSGTLALLLVFTGRYCCGYIRLRFHEVNSIAFRGVGP